MMRKLRAHLFHNVIGYAALFVALGGTAYAAVLEANTVGSVQIRNGSVQRHDTALGTVARVYGRYRDGPLFTEGEGGHPLLTVSLVRGEYMIVGKLTIVLNDERSYDCRLIAGDERVDTVQIANRPGQTATHTLTLVGLHASDDPFIASLECPDGTPGEPRDTMTQIKLIAVRMPYFQNARWG